MLSSIEGYRKEKLKRIPKVAPEIFERVNPRVFPNSDGTWMTRIDQVIVDITGNSKHESLSISNRHTSFYNLPLKNRNDFMSLWRIDEPIKDKVDNGNALNACPGCVAYIITSSQCVNTSIIGNFYEELMITLTVEAPTNMKIEGAPLVNQYGSIIGLIYCSENGIARAYAIDCLLRMIHINQTIILDPGIRWRYYHYREPSASSDGYLRSSSSEGNSRLPEPRTSDDSRRTSDEGALIIDHTNETFINHTQGINNRYLLKSASQRPIGELLLTMYMVLQPDSGMELYLIDLITGQKSLVEVRLRSFNRITFTNINPEILSFRDLLNEKITYFSTILNQQHQQILQLSEKIESLELGTSDTLKRLESIEDNSDLAKRIEDLEGQSEDFTIKIEDIKSGTGEFINKLEESAPEIIERIITLETRLLDINKKSEGTYSKVISLEDNIPDTSEILADINSLKVDLSNLSHNDLIKRVESAELALSTRLNQENNLIKRINSLESRLIDINQNDDLLEKIHAMEAKLVPSPEIAILSKRIEVLESSSSQKLPEDIISRLDDLEAKLPERVSQVEDIVLMMESDNNLDRITPLNDKINLIQSQMKTVGSQLADKLATLEGKDMKKTITALTKRLTELEEKYKKLLIERDSSPRRPARTRARATRNSDERSAEGVVRRSSSERPHT